MFSGLPEVTIPAHADYVSDPVPFPVNAFADVAITVHTDAPMTEQTGHPGSRATSYLRHGDLVSAPELPEARTMQHWYFIAGIDVTAVLKASAIVVLGDSITDGHGATTDGNDRWTDDLARRLAAQRRRRTLAVLNQGIGGNHLLTDGLGPNTLSRLDHDVIAQPSVRCVIVLEGINDIGMLAREGDAARSTHDELFAESSLRMNKSLRAPTHTTLRSLAPHSPPLSGRTTIIRTSRVKPTGLRSMSGFEAPGILMR
jgi:lysophospholipase L1-like esterase